VAIDLSRAKLSHAELHLTLKSFSFATVSVRCTVSAECFHRCKFLKLEGMNAKDIVQSVRRAHLVILDSEQGLNFLGWRGCARLVS
jgi:hypothetical protein